MAFTTGTATDYLDLLDKLRAYVLTQGWTVNSWVPGTVAGAGGSLKLMGPGAGPGLRVYLNFATYADVPNAVYSWAVRGATGYDPSAGLGLNPGEDFGANYLNLWQNSITYWFYVNDRRIIVVAQTSTAYVSMYAGFFLPWALPAQYPFPLYVAVDYASPVTWNFSNSARRMMCDPGFVSGVSAAGRIRKPDGTWANIFNQTTGAGTNLGIQVDYQTTGGFCWPWQSGANIQPTNGNDYRGLQIGSGDPTGLLDNLVNTAQNEAGLWPAELMGYNDVSWGELDGVYAAIGQVTIGQILTAGARTFKCFPNILRNTGNDFFAVEQA